jgi:hypothetical protein
MKLTQNFLHCSKFIKGVVCSKNVKHKRMISQHVNPRVLLLGGSLEYQKVSNKLASLNNVLQQVIFVGFKQGKQREETHNDFLFS